MSLSPEQKKLLIDVVNQKLAELEKHLELSEQSSKVVELDQALSGRVSRIDAIQQQKIAQAGLASAKHEQFRLKQVLASIDRDCFAECEECGESILFARLMIKPESVYCVNCQQQIES